MRIKKKIMLSLIPFLFLLSCNDKEKEEKCEHNYIKEVIEPTCVEKGYTINKCDKCGDEYVSNYVDELNHQYYKIYKESDDGTVYYELNCLICNNVDNQYLKTNINDLYGFNDLNRYSNKDSLHQFYANVVMVCDEFLESEIDLNPTNIVIANESKQFYVIDQIEYKSYDLSLSEALAVMNLVNLDNPKYYFLSSTIVYDSSYIYLAVEESCAKYSNRSNYNNILKALEIKATAMIGDELKQEEKIKVIHDFIITEIDYAYKTDLKTPEDTDWAHSILGPLLYKKGVCEAYSKSFKYICDLFSIDCLIVEGEANSASHSWNLVKIDDSWYGIDLTYDDSKKDITYNYFLIGYLKMKDIYIAYSSLKLSSEYIYLLPNISNDEYEFNN